MNYNQFMEELQKYYGLYPENSKIPQYVKGYLQRDIDETKLDRLFRFVTYHHSHRFGAPGIAEIEKSISEALYKKKGEDVHSTSFTPHDIGRSNTPEEDMAIQQLMNKEGLFNSFKEKIRNSRFKG